MCRMHEGKRGGYVIELAMYCLTDPLGGVYPVNSVDIQAVVFKE